MVVFVFRVFALLILGDIVLFKCGVLQEVVVFMEFINN
jgi:hypothetical protein